MFINIVWCNFLFYSFRYTAKSIKRSTLIQLEGIVLFIWPRPRSQRHRQSRQYFALAASDSGFSFEFNRRVMKSDVFYCCCIVRKSTAIKHYINTIKSSLLAPFGESVKFCLAIFIFFQLSQRVKRTPSWKSGRNYVCAHSISKSDSLSTSVFAGWP